LGESQPIADTPIAMSEQLILCLIAVATNLVVMLMLFAFMALPLARLAWQSGGVPGIILLIVVAQLFWIGPALLIVIPRDPDGASSYALWFGNWLVTGFAAVLLQRAASCIPRGLEDSARLDGLGAIGIWRHIVFPFVRRELGLLALFTVMATLLPFWGFITFPDAGNSIVLFQRFLSPPGRLLMMITGSLVGALPLIAIFFVARSRRSSPQVSPEKTMECPSPLARG
jgi:ABC-type glycerol-3-phosphate transport system permease component